MASNNNFRKYIFKCPSVLILTVFFMLFSLSPVQGALQTKEEIPEILGIKEWKSAYGPLRKKNLKGAVVLIHFSSFTDLRSLYKADTLINWQNKYYTYGFRVIHILTPDFSFEKEITIPDYLTKKKPVNYPVALDIKKAQWQAYRNPEKPFDFLVDARGRIRYKIPVSESYLTEEKMIQTLLKEKDQEFEIELETYPVEKIPETTSIPLGYKKDLRLGNFEKKLSEIRQNFKLPASGLSPDTIYLSGYWELKDEHAQTAEGGAELHMVWDGSPLFILAGIDRDSPTPVEVIIDGKTQLDKKQSGNDLVKQGEGYYVFPQKTKLYSLTKRLPEGPHTLVLKIAEAGAKFYAVSYPKKTGN